MYWKPENNTMGSYYQADVMAPGIVIGVVGMVVAIINYPIYKKILKNC